jgi:hypothetical protein
VPAFSVGDDAIWTGTAGLFERPVTIADVRPTGLLIFGEYPGSGPLVYDIHDAKVIKGIVFGIPGEQLRTAAPEPSPLPVIRHWPPGPGLVSPCGCTADPIVFGCECGAL